MKKKEASTGCKIPVEYHYLTNNEKLFMQCHEIVSEDLDMINLLNTIHKLKAGLSAVIHNNDGLIKSTRENYIS